MRAFHRRPKGHSVLASGLVLGGRTASALLSREASHEDCKGKSEEYIGICAEWQQSASEKAVDDDCTKVVTGVDVSSPEDSSQQKLGTHNLVHYPLPKQEIVLSPSTHKFH